MSAMYFYWCALCKTKDCKTWLVLKHIGREDEITDADLTLSRTGLPLPVRCGTCGMTHTYSSERNSASEIG